MDVTGYALITGGGSGMGRATAKAFARDGAAGVALLDLNASQLETVRREVEEVAVSKSFEVLTYVVDVTKEDRVQEVVDAVARKFGRLDYVMTAAGIAYKHQGGAAFADTENWNRVLDVNLNGTFYAVRAAAKIMLKQEPIKSSIDGRALQRGSIICISSVLGKCGQSESTGYTASKHAVIGLVRTASEDHAKDGLRINAICPGFIVTPMTMGGARGITDTIKERSETWTPMGRMGTPEEIADAVMYLAGGRSSFVTGSALMVDGGYTQH